VKVQRPERVSKLPAGPAGRWQYSVKLDGWRCIALVGDGVTLQARSGRDVTARFTEVLPALAILPAETVLDGELVAVRDGRFEFTALAGTARSRRTAGVSVSYVAFDALMVAGEDLRRLPLADRWARLLDLLDDAPAGLQPVMATEDRDEAEEWMTALAPIGVEGIVTKDTRTAYTPGTGHGWQKLRVSETQDGTVIDSYGRRLRVRLADGQEVVTQPLAVAQVRQVADALAEFPDEPLRVEVKAQTGRQKYVKFARVRAPD
jgi:ATP-dependent DNA ligase